MVIYDCYIYVRHDNLFKMKQEICKCGHDKLEHLFAPRIGHERCCVNLCTCKKFETQADYPLDDKEFWNGLKPKNHSQQSKVEQDRKQKVSRVLQTAGTPEDLKSSPGGKSSSGSDNSPRGKTSKRVFLKSIPEDTLSSKILQGEFTILDDDYIKIKDIKEFIKRLKEELKYTNLSQKNANRIIDKLAGKDLI